MDTAPRSRFAFPLREVLIALALVYAFLAGFHTTDFDTGWHLATGRYLVEHHEIPSTDQFSYTARGAEWIYPPFPGLIFYLLYSLGGFSALSWLTAAACVIAVALTVRRDEAITNALAIVAVPAIAFRTVARADLFNTVLFAALLRVVWSYFRGSRARLWLVPLLMLLWANLHLGFVAGLGILFAYVGMEVLELPFVGRRAAAIARLRVSWPWLAGGVVATLVNPWGVRLYRGVSQQPLLSNEWNYLVGEFARTPLSTAWGALDWRDPQMAYWWLMAVAAVAIVVAMSRKQLGMFALLAGAAYVSLSRVRFQAMSAIVVVMVAGAVLSDFFRSRLAVESGRKKSWAAAALAATGLLVVFTGMRSADLVSNRYYIRAADIGLFGAGPSWWYPERAAEFVRREHLPGNVFNDFNVGAYLTWRLGPEYPVYSDNRAIPFGTSLLFHQRALMLQPPDAPAWQREADKWGINTLFLSVARYGGLGGFPLPEFCASRSWVPVYLDDVAAVFVRKRPENDAIVQRLRINCATVAFTPTGKAGGRRGKAELFQFYANTGAILYLLSRDGEAREALDRAEQIFPYDAGVHLSKGQLLQANGRFADAEREYRTALRWKETSVGWSALGLLLESEKRWAEAAPAIKKAARLDVYPHGMYLHLGEVYLRMGEPCRALEAFGQARARSPLKGDAAPFGSDFMARAAEGEARAWHMLGDEKRAVGFEEQAVRLTPGNPARWSELAELYQADGRTQEAQQAKARAQELRSATGAR